MEKITKLKTLKEKRNINNDDDNDDNDDNNNNTRVYPNPLQWPTRTCFNWLVQTGHYTVWRDKSPKATVTSFKFRLLINLIGRL